MSRDPFANYDAWKLATPPEYDAPDPTYEYQMACCGDVVDDTVAERVLAIKKALYKAKPKSSDWTDADRDSICTMCPECELPEEVLEVEVERDADDDDGYGYDASDDCAGGGDGPDD